MTPDLIRIHQLQCLRVKPVHEGLLAEKRASPARSMDHRIRLESGQCKRLLAKHMLAGFRGLDRPFGVLDAGVLM